MCAKLKPFGAIATCYDKLARTLLAGINLAAQQALADLPQEVQQHGVTVNKANGDNLFVAVLYDQTD